MHTPGTTRITRIASAAIVFATMVACQDAELPTGGGGSLEEVSPTRARITGGSAPSGTAIATLGDRSFEFWPYTGTNLEGTRQDPVNLIFFGQADPRQIRAALMRLDGNRTAFGFPAAFPFDCTWNDAIGGMQTAYAADAGWIGSAVQLECGPYGPIRFHVRLFRAPGGTIGNAHVDLQIPGTSEHHVISWALAQQLVTVDMVRSGLLGAAPTPTAMTHSPVYGEIPAPLWNGMPGALRALTGNPPSAVAPAPVFSTGYAMQFELAGSVPVTPGEEVEDFVVEWNQIIPKPFCAAGPGHLIRVEGPVRFQQRSGIDASGNYYMSLHTEGALRITPVTPPPGTPSEPYDAFVNVRHAGTLTDVFSSTLLIDIRKETPDVGPYRGSSRKIVRTGPTREATQQHIDVDC